jgi:iron(III) transport system permease protein
LAPVGPLQTKVQESQIKNAMVWWRLTLAVLLILTVALPAAMPFLELLQRKEGWQVWAEGERLLFLAGNTLGLVLGTLALALPAGIIAAVVLYRTDLPLRRAVRFLTLLTLFIPLPLFTTAWQGALGTGGWLPVAVWSAPPPGDPDIAPSGSAWKPWAQGLGAAIWVHAMAGLPWVIVLAGQGLCWVERGLEEDALTVAAPWRVLWRVTLPRCRAAIFAAGLWVALMAATEITVTDVMQVRTFAEEIYTQLVAGDRAALAHAVAVSLPAVLVTWAMMLWATRRWEQTLPPLDGLLVKPRLFRLGWVRGPCLVAVLSTVTLLVGVPLASLVWKTGLAGNPQVWSAPVAAGHLMNVVRARAGMVVESCCLAAFAGMLTAALGLLVSWLALGSRWFHLGVLSLMAAIWALPGPLIGIGLKQTIALLLDWIPAHSLAVALYYGPSPLPGLWAHMLRFFPCAVAMLWPVVRLLPPELHETALVDGARPRQELWHLVLPLTAPICLRAGLAVAILSLGELGAGKLVATPGSQSFAHEVFTQMHYGVTNDLAALCLVLLAVIVLGTCLFAMGRALTGKRWGDEVVRWWGSDRIDVFTTSPPHHL